MGREAEDPRAGDPLGRAGKRRFPNVDRLCDREGMIEGFRAFAERRGPAGKGR